jgi:hypothetical protein
MNTSLRSISNNNIKQRCASFLSSCLSQLEYGFSCQFAQVKDTVKRSVHTLRISRATLLIQVPRLTLTDLTLLAMGPELSSMLRGSTAHAALAHVSALTNSCTKRVNARVLIGLGLVLYVAPFAETVYTHFDFNARVPEAEWYYESWFFLFLSLGPYIDKAITVIACYYLFAPRGTKRSYFLVAPLGFAFGKITWLLFVTNDKEFHAVAPWMYVLYAAFVVGFIIWISRYLIWRWFHRGLAHQSRLGTINKAYEYQLLDKATLADQYYITVKEMEARNY